MSKKLFVGCRVRIVACHEPPCATDAGKFVGAEGRITAAGRKCAAGIGYRVDSTDTYVWFDDELEPTQPQGAAPSELTFTELMDRCRAGEVECV